MIIQPDFLRHWKTRKLISMTGDPAAPLALIRLWGHCQTSRRWTFPGLKRDDLAAICEWPDAKTAKLSCEKALVACAWISRIRGGGYTVNGWEHWNKNLVANWLRNPTGKAKEASEDDPTGTPRGARCLPDKPDQTNPINQTNQTNQTNPTNGTLSPVSAPVVVAQLRATLNAGGDGLDSVKTLEVDGGKDGRKAVEGLASSIAQKLTSKAGVPTLQAVRNYLLSAFNGAADYAEAFYKAMEKSHWQDKTGQPINDWKAMAKRYASTAYMKRKR